ncbi:hypothetical protein L3Q82_017164, partial [Scortum barcoo]
MSLQQVEILMFTCPGLHHRLFTYSASPPPLRFPQAFVSLSALTVLKSGSSTLASGMLAVSHVSVRHIKLHSLKVFRFFVSAASSSILFGSEFMFPMIIEGTGGLNLHFFASRLAFSIAPALQPRYGFHTSTDQEKAFDRIEHNFLWKVMERFGFSAGFTAKIKEPLIYGARLDVCSDATPCLMAALHQTKTLCLQQLVDAVGPALTDAQELGSLLGIQSVRVAQRILELWRQRLSGKEKSLIAEYSRKTSEPDPKDPFPEILLSPVLEEASGPLLVTCNPTNLSLHKADNKTLYRNCVKSMNRRELSGRPLTAWTSRLGADDGATPQWRVLYKPPLKKRTADLQWRIFILLLPQMLLFLFLILLPPTNALSVICTRLYFIFLPE